jgi:sterol desaturase/sphingolipid hydroxylase (fatty acid hydroxylase superfamily)
MFPWWDMMFGTAWMPGRDEWPEVGVPEYEKLRTAIEMLARPFVGLLRRTRLHWPREIRGPMNAGRQTSPG